MLVALAKHRKFVLKTISNHVFHTYGLVVGLILATCFLDSIYKLKFTLNNSTVIAGWGLLHAWPLSTKHILSYNIFTEKKVKMLKYIVSLENLLYIITMMKLIAPINAVPKTPPTIASMFWEDVSCICGNKI